MERYITLFEYMTPAERKQATTNGQSSLKNDPFLDKERYFLNAPHWILKQIDDDTIFKDIISDYKLSHSDINNKVHFHNNREGRIILLDNDIFWSAPADNARIVHDGLLKLGIVRGLASCIKENEYIAWWQKIPKSFICLFVDNNKLFLAESYWKSIRQKIEREQSILNKFNIQKLGFDKMEF